jgi:hypothetical protein
MGQRYGCLVGDLELHGDHGRDAFLDQAVCNP